MVLLNFVVVGSFSFQDNFLFHEYPVVINVNKIKI